MNEDILHFLSCGIINNSIVRRVVNGIELCIIMGHLPKTDKYPIKWYASLVKKDNVKFKFNCVCMGTSKEEAINELIGLFKKKKEIK